LVFFVCLLPLALYCLFLAWINGAGRAWIISGGWDFAGILLAMSGLLLAGGPAILTGLSEDWRAFWTGMFPGRPWARLGTDSATHSYLLLGIAYIVLVVFLAGFTLWRRRHTTVLYNLDSEAFEAVLAQVMQGLGLNWIRSGNLICWQPRVALETNAETKRKSPASVLAETAIQLAPALPPAPTNPASVPIPDDERWATVTQTLRLEMNPSLHYACLHWSTVHGWPRQIIEEELNRRRVQLHAPDNPLSFWLLIVATLFILGIFIGMLTMLILTLWTTRAGY
jgi:hypothetical protein